MRCLIPFAAVALATVAGAPSIALAQAKIITLDADSRDDRFEGRYVFRETDDGVLRLDRETGDISFCAPDSAGWSCQAVSEEQHDYQQEISRLQSENADLRAALRERSAPPTAPLVLTPPASNNDNDRTAAIPQPDGTPAPPDTASGAKPPDSPSTAKPPEAQASIEPSPGKPEETQSEAPPQTQPATVRTMSVFERAWHRLIRMMVDLQRHLQKGS